MIEFGPFRYDAESRFLYRGDEEIMLPPRVLAVLESLLKRPGKVVSKDAVLESAWDGAFVGEDSLTQAISQLRSALGDDPRRPTCIQTIPKRGYRFIAEVSEPLVSQGPVPKPVEEEADAATAGAAAPAEAAAQPTGTDPRQSQPAARNTDPQPYPAATPLAAGTAIGNYELVSQIGAGAMGEVWRARDTELQRDVAIKVVPQELAGEAAVIERFRREALMLAAVNHPNIATIHGIEELKGSRFIVMELLEGETLQERLEAGALPVDDALEIAIQITRALSVAHDAGIVHRDLKPANIMLGAGNHVKVLDFGLAKDAEATDGSETLDPTLLTASGLLVGTAAYMSPEQAAGKPIDKRSDIFSFACVLFEMLAGQRPFAGDGASEIVAAILRDEPAWSELPSTIPRPVQRLLRRCLEKNPDRRMHDIADARIEIEELSIEDPSAARRPPAASRTFPLVAAALIAGIALGWLAARIAGPSAVPDRPAPTITPVTSFDGYERDPALSPDGRLVAFIWDGGDGGRRQLYVKLLAGSAPPQPLTDEDSNHRYPAWSPNGDWIAFERWSADDPEVEILMVSALGGSERLLHTYPSTCPDGGLDWAPDGRHLAFSGCSSATEPPGIFLLSMTTGERHQITFPPGGDVEGEMPWFDERLAFSTDGSNLAFLRTALRSGLTQLWVQAMEGEKPSGEPRMLAFPEAFVWDLDWTEEGDAVVYSHGLSFANSYLNILPLGGGEPSRLPGGDRARHLSIVAGRLVYSKWQDDANIWRIGGPTAEEAGVPTKVFSSNWDDIWPAYSPTGDWVAFVSDRLGTPELWLAAAEGGEPPQRITDLGYAQLPRWHPDGDRIAFTGPSTTRPELPAVNVVDVPGAFARNVTDDVFQDSNPDWSSDGEWIYFQSLRDGGDPYEIWRMPSDGGPATKITAGGDLLPRPHGERVYFWRSGRVWSAAAEGGDEKMVLDTPVESWDLWNGKLIYMYETGLRTASIGIFDLVTNETHEHTTIEIVQPNPNLDVLSVSPDGLFIVYSRVDTAGSDLVLVENFR